MGAPEQSRGLDAEVAALAERQFGVVSRGQLADLGIDRRGVARRLQTGRLHQLHGGVYAVGHRVIPREGHWLAAVLFCGPGAVLSHRSAAAHWGIRDYSGAYVDVTSPRKTRSTGSIRRHWALLRSDEVTEHDGIPITTPPRTIFDLAPESPPHVVEAALRQSEFLRLYDSLSLWDLLERYPRRRGNPAVRAALASLEEASGETRSRLEERFLAFLDAHRLPRPNLNVWLEINGHRYKVDCLWPAHRQIVELDSWEAHGTRSAFQTDRSRARRLEAAGYRVTHVTRHQLETEGEELAMDLRTLLRANPLTATAPARGLR